MKQDDPFPEGMVEEWAKFLAESHQPEDVFDTSLMFPLQRRGEWRRMMGVAFKTGPKCEACSGTGDHNAAGMIESCRRCHGMGCGPQTVMEIGADKGGGLWTWCKCLPTLKRVIACEIRGTPYSGLFERAFPHIRFLWLPCSSLTDAAVATVKNFLMLHAEQVGEDGNAAVMRPAKIDVLFIDGDKSWFHSDFTAYLPLMDSSKGVVFMHDVTDPAPGSAFEICRAGFRSEVIIDRSDADEECRREAQGIAATTAHQHWLRHWRGTSCGVGVIHVGRDG